MPLLQLVNDPNPTQHCKWCGEEIWWDDGFWFNDKRDPDYSCPKGPNGMHEIKWKRLDTDAITEIG